MAIFRRSKQPPKQDAGTPRAVLAAAIPLVGPEAAQGLGAKQTTEQWQNDAWYFYDAVGELRSAVTWIANAISKADLFGAETDPETGLVTGPTEDARAQAAASMCLGGSGRRAQLQHLLAVCWQVPGEAYVIVRGRPLLRGKPQPDEWLVLSGQRVKAKSKAWTYQDPITLGWVELGARDRMIRVWSPHPNDQSKADTAVRPALPVLREIEKSSMNLSAVLDSRIATAGIHAIPHDLDLPLTGGNSSVAEELSDMLLRAASAGIQNPGTAAAQVPVIVSMPSDMIESFVAGRINPDTSMDQTVMELRERDLARLASALDMPKEVAAGTMGEANHWSAWQVEESTYKLFIEPLLDRVGDALTEYWYRPVLEAMGVESPERHTLAWDTTGIVARPDQTEDLNWLYDNGLISDDYRRAESGIPDDAVPDEAESQMRRLERIVMGAPTLAADPEIAQRLFGFEIAPEAAGVSAEGADAIEGTDGAETSSRALPAGQSEPDATEVPEGLTAAAELIVFDALSRAGGRLLTREHRGQFASTPKHELHTVIACDAVDTGRLLADSFLWAERVAASFGVDPDGFRGAVQGYTRGLLRDQAPHSRTALVRALGDVL